MDPWKSWAIVGVVGAGAAYYYTQSGKSKQGRGGFAPLQGEKDKRQISDARNDSRDSRKKKGKAKAADGSDQSAHDTAKVSSASVPSASGDNVKKRKGAKQQPSKLAQSSAVDTNSKPEIEVDEVHDEEEEMSNQEFARQLAGLKTGTSLKKSETPNRENKKNRKQGKSKDSQLRATNGTPLMPNDSHNTRDVSTTSSTTGADADDDLSLPVSPSLGATQSPTPAGGDVSDMLEAPAKGPSILKISQSASPQPTRQQKPKKTAAEPETKKQRQNRQKAEEKKAIREQAEKERMLLLEKQRRTAREAEGRPAKNGVGVSKAPSSNAWDKTATSTTNGSSTQSLKQDTGELLDTFDEDKAFLGQAGVQENEGPSNKSMGNEKVWNRDVPSEEEQMRLIAKADSDDNWNTVGKGGKGKKKTKVASDDKPNFSGSIIQSMGNNTESSSNYTNDFTSDDNHSSMTGNMPSDVETPVTASQAKDSGKGQGIKRDHLKDNMKESHKPVQTSGAEPEDFIYSSGVAASTCKRWRAIAKNLDRNVWNHDNIHEHPDYDLDWPYALTGHPKDSDWVGDWDAEDMRKAEEKRAKDEAAQKAERSTPKGKN